ncbi:MAG: hypothetical protein E7676_03520 [Ruminococcaceae bacterium]|nr:hypothetical protein [Oscillospiraceae bacterium]
MKKQTKIIVLAISLVLLVASCIGITAFAVESEPEKSLNIISQKVEYSEKMYLYYAVYPENVDTEGLVLNVYAADPDKNAEAELLATVTAHEEVVIPGGEDVSYTCRAFETPGVALKNLATEFFVQAVAADGTKSPVRRYSVVEYLNEMIFTTDNEDKAEAYGKLLAAGDAAQLLLDYYPGGADDIPTNYRYVKVTDGIVTGEYKKGAYLVGDEISLTYTGDEKADTWNLYNKAGELVDTVSDGETFSVTESVLCVPHTYRGTGIYLDRANDFSNISTWATTTQKGEAVENEGLYAEHVLDNGDYALRFVSNAPSNEAYINIPRFSPEIGNVYAFETDLKVNSDVAACASTRTGGEIFHIYYGGATFVNWALDSITISYDTTDAENPVLRMTATGLDYTFDLDSWINLRVEFEDVKQADHVIKYYVNGQLVGSGTKAASTNSISQLRICMPGADGKTATGTLYLDNTFFGTVGNAGSRGEGSYASDANTLTYTGTTATALGEAGKMTATNGATLDGEGITASVVNVNGDAALHLSNNPSASAGYFNIASDVLNKNKYVFETDIMFIDATSNRSSQNYEFLQFYSSTATDGSSSFWGGMTSLAFTAKTVDDVTTYYVERGEGKVVVNPGEWVNIRFEFEDWKTTGSAIKYYVNGELIYTGATTKTTTAFRFIRLWAPPSSTANIYIDNTCFKAIQ